MAEPKKRGDKYRHSVMIEGRRHTGTFDTKKAAREWEAGLRVQSKERPNGQQPERKHKLTKACDRYLEEITPTKRGDDAFGWESRRLATLCERFAGRNIEDITSDDISAWKAALLKDMSGSTVTRYFNLFSHLFSVARREWKWIAVNPFSDVPRPEQNQPRQLKWGWREIRRVLREGEARGGSFLEVTRAFHISLRTALRLQEALAAPGNVSNCGRVLLIKKRKESRYPTRIPLTPAGSRLIRRTDPFEVNPKDASTLFSRMIKEMGMRGLGLQYRDSRATALTHMCKTMPIEELMQISRHKDAELLIDVYYRDSAEEIAERIAVRKGRGPSFTPSSLRQPNQSSPP